MDEENEVQQYNEDGPDVDFLKADLDRVKTTLSYYNDRAEDARDIRMSVWPGKGKYGRKEGPDAFPWPGASDLSGQVINGILDGDVALLKSSLNKSNLIAAPTESGDIMSAKMVTEFMRWRMSSIEELPREAGVAANLLLEQGCCFLGVYFRQEIRRVYRPITLEEIAATSPEFATAIADPDMGESVRDIASGAFPNLSKKRINKMIRELQKDGQTEIPTEKTTMSRPSVRAYELGVDLFVDSNILSLDAARAIYCQHYYSIEDLKAKVITDGWDADFVDEVIELTAGDMDDGYQGGLENLYTSETHAPEEQNDGLVKLITCYRKEIDEDGVPICNVVIFSEKAEGYAIQYPMTVDAGRYPFVAITRETISRRLLQSRGYPEILRDIEMAVKSEVDSRRDAASLSTVPPLEYMVGRRPEKIGPGSQVPVRRRGELGYMTIPPLPAASTQVEEHLRGIANKLTGRATGPEDAVEAQVIKQTLVNTFLHGWSQVLKRMWALDRAYNQEIWFRVTNNAEGMRFIMDETAEEYDFNLTFNTINNDEEKVIQKLQSVGQIMAQYDRQGQARYDVFLRTFLDAIDPNMASQLIMPAQEATTKEIIETSNDIAKIASGQVVNAPQGANAQLRLQVMQQYLQGTEQIPAEDVQARLQQDEKFRQRMETYQGQLTFMIQQQQNALTGQLGTAPGNVPATAA